MNSIMNEIISPENIIMYEKEESYMRNYLNTIRKKETEFQKRAWHKSPLISYSFIMNLLIG